MKYLSKEGFNSPANNRMYANNYDAVFGKEAVEALESDLTATIGEELDQFLKVVANLTKTSEVLIELDKFLEVFSRHEELPMTGLIGPAVCAAAVSGLELAIEEMALEFEGVFHG
ncbi:MAG: hypothetical protein L3J47_00195 [Sulfurovum sp.]|nr:hypothetical protein [Sulfurovum sp.]